MSQNYFLSPRAQRDLDEIWDYTVESWDIDQADAYVQKIHAALRMLTNNAGLGRDCAAIRKGYKKYPVGSHSVFYTVFADGIKIVRILYQGMDEKCHL